MRDDMATTPIVVDIETAGLANAADYLEPVQADKRLKDPAKIAQDIAEKEQARLDRLALDWNVGYVAVLGWWTAETGLQAYACKDELTEIASIAHFWRAAQHRTIVGFNIKAFDLRYLVQRSRFLGITHPSLDFSKYSRKGISDLYLDLTFNEGHFDQGAMRRTLGAFCKRFGIPCDNTVKGSDIAALLAKGDWDGAVAHCLDDVCCTAMLAQRLGVVNAAAVIDGIPARV